VIYKSLPWLVVCAGVAAVACDQAVPDEGPMPRGEITKTSMLVPIDTLGGVLGGVLGDPPPPDDCAVTGCPQSTDPCWSSVCNTNNGVCEIQYNDDVNCDDGNMCTAGDKCAKGTCAGTPRVCVPSDQCHDAGTCNAANGTCSNPIKPNGTACTDNNACTQSDTCQSGVCMSGQQRACPASDQCHDVGSCNTSTGACSNPIKPNGTACTDNNACTQSDACQDGVCTAGTARQCPTPDQCHTAGTCDPSTGNCSNPNKPNGTACNDGMACTQPDQCTNGVCTGAVSCPAADQCHDPGTCGANGVCTSPIKPNGTTCTDGSLCTTGDACLNGACRSTSSVTCAAIDQCHDPGVCNDSTGQCSRPLKPAGSPCSDNMLCTYADKCDATGTCAGTTVACVSDESTIRECDGTATCKITPRPGAACDDGNPCTKGDARKMDGSCAGTAYTCDVGPCMTASACDGQGGCIPTAKADGTACDADGSKCTPHDRCQGGACIRDPAPVTCVKRDCFTVACNAATGNCDYTPTSGETCGVTGCFTMGTCSNGVCSGTPKDCSSFNGPCTTGICDARSGACAAEYKSNGTSCDPGGLCVAGAVCAFGICELPPATCAPPSGPCKVAACMPSNGACYEMNLPAGTTCDPKTSCMGPGLCDDQGRCFGSPAPNGDSCTLAGGAVGLCVAGSCITTGAAPPDASVQDAGPLDGGNPPPRKADGCDCAVGGTGAGPPALLLAALALGVAIGRGRRRAAAGTRQTTRETGRPRAR
jgi:MYXO-CTERM domain-containing protein